jgi:hypothetical protein
MEVGAAAGREALADAVEVVQQLQPGRCRDTVKATSRPLSSSASELIQSANRAPVL